ncbi:hypothetical protein BIFDEN_01210 [Bifidobacterium dentium ATCC 27678]|nr:hypothetical protein BIFDEN_01210 [Bifidobacterium dentium ATCC 27678]
MSTFLENGENVMFFGRITGFFNGICSRLRILRKRACKVG